MSPNFAFAGIPNTDPCTANSDCSAGMYCDGIGQCNNQIPNGNSCDNNAIEGASSSCQSTVCTSGTCGACATNSDCGIGFVCSGAAACQLVDCGGLSSPANGIVSTPSTTYLSEAIYSCNDGFELSGGPSTRICQDDGNWSGVAPICGVSVTIGGEIIPIETTVLLLADARTFSWMIPVTLSILGIGLFVVSRKSKNS